LVFEKGREPKVLRRRGVRLPFLTFKNSFSVVINYIIATILGLILLGGFTVRDLRVFVGEQVQFNYTWPVVFLF